MNLRVLSGKILIVLCYTRVLHVTLLTPQGQRTSYTSEWSVSDCKDCCCRDIDNSSSVTLLDDIRSQLIYRVNRFGKNEIIFVRMLRTTTFSALEKAC